MPFKNSISGVQCVQEKEPEGCIEAASIPFLQLIDQTLLSRGKLLVLEARPWMLSSRLHGGYLVVIAPNWESRPWILSSRLHGGYLVVIAPNWESRPFILSSRLHGGYLVVIAPNWESRPWILSSRLRWASFSSLALASSIMLSYVSKNQDVKFLLRRMEANCEKGHWKNRRNSRTSFVALYTHDSRKCQFLKESCSLMENDEKCRVA